MTTPVFGPEPDAFQVNLPLDEDFVAEITIPDTELALNEAARVLLRFMGTEITWEGAIQTGGRRILFNIDELEVAVAREAKPRQARLQYVDGAIKLPWVIGRVRNV